MLFSSSTGSPAGFDVGRLEAESTGGTPEGRNERAEPCGLETPCEVSGVTVGVCTVSTGILCARTASVTVGTGSATDNAGPGIPTISPTTAPVPRVAGTASARPSIAATVKVRAVFNDDALTFLERKGSKEVIMSKLPVSLDP